MIHIEKDQSIYENNNLRVLSNTGDYDDNQLIEVYDVEKPETVSSFAAQFIKYGSIVYKFSTPPELGEEILKNDPESTHSAASYVRMQKELLRQITEDSLESDSLSKVLDNELIKNESTITSGDTISSVDQTDIQETVSLNTDTEVLPDVSVDTTTANSTSTVDTVTASSTDAVIEIISDVGVGTTTANSTSTIELQ